MLRSARFTLVIGLLLSTSCAIWLSQQLSSCRKEQEYCAAIQKHRRPDSIDQVGFPNYVSKHEPPLRHEILWDADRRDQSYSLKLRPFRINDKLLDATFVDANTGDTTPTCEPSTYLLLLIPSAPANFERRKFIRTTWANELYGGSGWSQFGKQREIMRIVFVLGLPEHKNVRSKSKASNASSTSSSIIKQVSEESGKYRDILWFDVVDTYRNLTVKVLSGFEYACGSCLSRYVLKVDDDVFVALPLVLAELRRREIDLIRTAFHGFGFDSNDPQQFNDADKLRQSIESRLLNSALFKGASVLSDSILCAVNPSSQVFRKGDWAVSEDEYPFPTWPPYCAGNAYLTSSQVVCRLSWAARHVPVLHIEDAFITGVLVRAAGLQHVNFDSRMTRWGTRMATACDFLSTGRLVATNFDLENGYRLWQELQAADCPIS